ncbi:Protein NRT1/ PTR FAMILY 6.3 [Glycine soja]
MKTSTPSLWHAYLITSILVHTIHIPSSDEHSPSNTRENHPRCLRLQRSPSREVQNRWLDRRGVEACERLTTMGVAVNLATYLTGTMHLGSANSANTVTNFMGTSLMLCLFGGFVADTFIGSLHPPKCIRDATRCCMSANNMQLMVLYIALYTTSLGIGGLKSSVSGFGTDQFDDSDKGEKKQMLKFFNWFVFFISLGTLTAVTVLVYIQDHIGRYWGYGISVCAMLVALLVLLSSTRRYRYKRLVGSPLTQIAMVFVAAWRKRHLELPSDSSLLFNLDDVADESLRKNKQMLPHSKQFRFLDKAAIKDPKMDGEEITMQRNWYLSTLTDVEEVKMVQRMLPVWATTIMFWTVYSQMTTFSVQQATTMDRRIRNSFQIPAASLTVFFVGSVLLTVPIYDRVITPIAKKISHNPQGLTPLQRIGVGLVFSIFAMVSAALIEIKRLRMAQFFFVGSGEAFTYIGQLDFFLRECPRGMKTMSTGLFLSTLSLGFFLSSLLVTLVHKATRHREPWLADNLNHGRLHHFYWLLALLSGVNLVAYLFCAKGYVYKDKRLAEAGIELEETDTACHA